MTDSLLAPPQDQSLTLDPSKNYLEELVGEGKKFKDPESLARGKFEADRFIEHKNREFDQLREDYLKLRSDYNTSQKLGELLDKLSTQQSDTMNSPPVVDTQKPIMDPEQFNSLVSKQIQEYEAQKRETENMNLVRSKLQERFGADYAQQLKSQATNLGLTDTQVDDLARKAPRAFFKTLGLDDAPAQSGFQAPPRSNVRSDNFSPTTQKRTWSYWQNVKRTDPQLYLSPSTQTQILKDAVELGPAFKDGDFSAYGD